MFKSVGIYGIHDIHISSIRGYLTVDLLLAILLYACAARMHIQRTAVWPQGIAFRGAALHPIGRDPRGGGVHGL